MDWTAPVDIYCERLGPEFWAEPWNAVSNLAFILAGFWGWQTARRLGTRNLLISALIGLAFAIGIGSFLFHSFATVWASLADVVPIWSFVALYIIAAIRIMTGASAGRIAIYAILGAAILTILLLAMEDGKPRTGPDPFNGSLQYAPAVIAMLVFSALSLWRGHPIRYWFLAATVTFLVSLSMRTIDMRVCETIPQGTHYLWHILNGAMIALLLQGLIRRDASNRP